MKTIAIIEDDIHIGDMLPGLSGEEVLGHIRNIPVIVLSAKAAVQDKVNLLLLGAADYMTKPFHCKKCDAGSYQS